MVLDVSSDNGDSRFIKHLLALSMRARQQGMRGGQEMENNARCLGKAYGCSLRLLTHTSWSTAGTFLLGRPFLRAWLLILRFELVFSSSFLQATELLRAEFFPFRLFLHLTTARLFDESLFQTSVQKMPVPEGSTWPHLFTTSPFQLGIKKKNKVSGTWKLVHWETHLPETLWGRSALRLEQITMSDTDHDAPESSIKVSNYGENLVSESRKMW